MRKRIFGLAGMVVVCAGLLLFAVDGVLAFPEAYEPVNELCPKRLALDVAGESRWLPYCTTHILDEETPNVSRAVIVIHGANRTASNYFYSMNTAAEQAEMDLINTLILAPQFLIEEDLAHFGLDSSISHWSYGGWKRGDRSKDAVRESRLSTFEVLDQILTILSDEAQYPELKDIVIIGHSAGGQYVNRYAVSSAFESNLERADLHIRYVVANPSSYLYLDANRRVEGSLDEFAIPEAPDCPEYNQYKYGLEEGNTYLTSLSEEQLKAQYAQREVVYMLGSEDTDPEANLLDISCEAMLQGSQRFERGQVYYNYLRWFYGEAITAHQRLAVVPGVGHSSADMFQSNIGKEVLFDVAATIETATPLPPTVAPPLPTATTEQIVEPESVETAASQDAAAVIEPTEEPDKSFNPFCFCPGAGIGLLLFGFLRLRFW